MTPPGDREFGELIGKVDGIGAQINDLTRRNSAEHERTSERLERMEGSLREAIEGKADVAWVKDHEAWLKSLTTTRDKLTGAKLLAVGSIGAVLTAIGYFVHG